MKILIAPDKFKGSLSAQEVCEAIGNGFKKNIPTIETIYHPMADGGDGSLEILSKHLALKKQSVKTVDPIGREISTHYFTSSDAAFIEVASASGLVLLTQKERSPLFTSTIGTGKMMADALSKGFEKIYLFLGGSATNDAGMGIASELGFQFLDKNKNELSPNGENLSKVKFIHSSPIFDFKKIEITLLCDVNNPMIGTNGAAHIYASQKGATAEQVLLLNNGLINFSRILNQHCKSNVSELPGGGAAGAIGAGLVALLNANLKKGFETISQLTNLEKQIAAADWVISGEGKLDEQSLQGKVVNGIATLCEKYNKPLSLFVGKNELSKQQIKLLNTKSIFSISEQTKDLEDAMLNGEIYLRQLAMQFSPSLK
ncbi:MAG: glycerate kinase [Saprospiraceae bacterium]